MKIRRTVVSGAVVGVILATASGASADTSPGGSTGATGSTATSALQAEVNHQLASTHGGIQVASNVVSYDSGTVRVVLPLPGQTSAVDPMIAQSEGSASPLFSTEGCPWGWDVKWSCFYTGGSFTGTMLEFEDCGYTQYFDTYGQGDNIWSWVNTKDAATVNVFGIGGGSQFLWAEGTNAQNANVGSYDATRAWQFYIYGNGDCEN